MHRVTRIAAGIGALSLASTFTLAGQVSAHPDVVGHVYVNDNTAGTNTVAGFARHTDGTLTPLPGSPFAVGGAGTGTVTGSQGSIQESSDGRYLLVADAGSNQISVLRLHHDGNLQPVEGSPFSSGGNTPISIAVHDRLVYVANSGNGGSNYTGFRLSGGGHLRPLDDSTYWLPDGSGPGDILFSPDGTRLAATRVNTSLIDSFAVERDGELTPASGSPYAAQGQGPFGSEFRPTAADQLFISNAHDGKNNGTISAYDVAHDGALHSVAGSPFHDNQTAPCWVEISHDGKFLFTVNTAVPSISRFSIAHDGSLTLLGATPFNGGSGLRPFDLRLDPSGRYLYVTDAGTAQVSAFAVDGGNLTELASSPFALPAGATPFGIVVD